MDRLLSLSQAARMVGVTRKILQEHIQNGQLSTFEGYIRMSELLKVYPETNADQSAIIEKVRRIKDAAVAKGVEDAENDPERLAAELHRLKIKLGMVEDQLEDYRYLAQQMEHKLVAMQKQCDDKQAAMLNTLAGWLMHQIKLREYK